MIFYIPSKKDFEHTFILFIPISINIILIVISYILVSIEPIPEINLHILLYQGFESRETGSDVVLILRIHLKIFTIRLRI